MRKILLSLTVVCLTLGLSGCRTNRVWTEEDLRQIAFSDFGFSDYYFFKVVSPDTALALTGTSFSNGGVIAGRLGAFDRMIFVPKKTADQPFVINFPFNFTVSDILEALNALEDDQGQPLYNVTIEDFGGLAIGVELYEAIAATNPEMTFDTQIVFSFTTGAAVWHTFHVMSAGGVIRIFAEDYEVLT